MSEFTAKEVFNRRLPLYAYLEPLLAGRRVLELGSGTGEGAAYLATHGAAEVTAIDTDGAAVERARARHAAPNVSFRVAGGLLDVVPAAPFDVVIVPEAEAVLRRPDAVPALARLVAQGGRLVLVATSADRGPAGAGGLGYYELTDALLPQFPAVQMFGVTPFAGFGVVEFDVDGDGLRVDSRLVEGGAEAPTAYVAVAGSARAAELGYALVQVPFAPIEGRLAAAATPAPEITDVRGGGARLSEAERRLDDVERRSRARVEEAEARAGELRRKADDAAAEAESAMRVARAQGAEIEELRGRLRRASEDRAALDGELAKLRRALAEADESVMNLTRKTAEEMSAVAARLAEGLRAPVREAPREDTQRLRLSLSEAESRASAAEQRLEEVAAVGRERQAALDDVMERLKLAEEATARERAQVSRLRAQLGETTGAARLADERETTLARRDERIAKLEGEKQELVWRLAEFEEKLRQTIGRAVISDRTDRAQADELDAVRASRTKALEDFHRVAGAQLGELTDLRASVAEQAALVAELEEALRVAEGAASTAASELAALRKNTKGLEEADRTRRTRLAELEGKLLRLEHERKQALQAGAAAPGGGAATAELERRLDAAVRERDAAVRERDELRANLARVMAAAAESAEALARTTAELGGSRAKVAALEAEVARLANGKSGNGHGGEGAATARELAAIEAGLRDELSALSKIESALAEELASAQRPAAARPEAELEASAGADAILLHATLGNYRRHAARLRDELEGVRRRLDSLSPSEISGYLEELGEDLAEMEE
jgi:SAM-dependent methyltransferase